MVQTKKWAISTIDTWHDNFREFNPTYINPKLNANKQEIKAQSKTNTQEFVDEVQFQDLGTTSPRTPNEEFDMHY